MFHFFSLYVFANPLAIARMAVRAEPYASQILLRMTQDFVNIAKYGVDQSGIYDNSHLQEIVDNNLGSFTEKISAALFEGKKNVIFSFSDRDINNIIYRVFKDYPNLDSNYLKSSSTTYSNIGYTSSDRFRIMDAKDGYSILTLDPAWTRTSYSTQPNIDRENYDIFLSDKLVFKYDNTDVYTRQTWEIYPIKSNDTELFFTNNFENSSIDACDPSIKTCSFSNRAYYTGTLNYIGEFPTSLTLSWLNNFEAPSQSTLKDFKNQFIGVKIVPNSVANRVIDILKNNAFSINYNNVLTVTDAQGNVLINEGNEVLKDSNGTIVDPDSLKLAVPSALIVPATVTGTITYPVTTTGTTAGSGSTTTAENPAWYDIIGWLQKIYNAILSLVTDLVDSLIAALTQLFEFLFVPNNTFSERWSALPSLYFFSSIRNVIFSTFENIRNIEQDAPCLDSNTDYEFMGVTISSQILNEPINQTCDIIKNNYRIYITGFLMVLFAFYLYNFAHFIIRGSNAISPTNKGGGSN